jgi:hypothetical protein
MPIESGYTGLTGRYWQQQPHLDVNAPRVLRSRIPRLSSRDSTHFMEANENLAFQSHPPQLLTSSVREANDSVHHALDFPHDGGGQDEIEVDAVYFTDNLNASPILTPEEKEFQGKIVENDKSIPQSTPYRVLMGCLLYISCHLLYFRQLLTELGFKQNLPTPLMCDNQGALFLIVSTKNHPKIKHISIKFHFVRQAVNDKAVSVHFVPTKDQLADVFTKPLSYPAFSEFRKSLGIQAWGGERI